MERLDGHDELLARISAVDPGARLAPMTDGALDRVTRHAMSPAPKAWTWRRFKLASLGALVGSGALVIAGILGIESAAQTFPILALGGQSATSKAGPNAPTAWSGNAMMIPYESFQFTVDPSLSSAAGSGTAYQLSSSIDASTAASQVAQALSVPGDVVSQGDGSYQVGPDNGPDVSTWTSDGIVGFYFESASTASSDGSLSTPLAPTDPTGPLPTNAQAAQWATALLGNLGVTSDLGTPSITSDNSEVDVTVPIAVDGLSTDQTFYVAYGPNSTASTPDSVSGEFVTAAAATTYPTISQTDAANVVISDNGLVFCGGIVPINSSGSTGASGASGTSGSSPGSPPSSGPVGNASPPFTTPTTTIPEPVVDVDLNQATMQLATFSGADGSSWLLPSWAISGPETGSTVTPGTSYTANVLAVDAQYVQLQACPMVF